MDQEELEALTKTLSSIYNFHKYQIEQIVKPRLLKYQSLTEEEKQLVPWYTKHTEDLKESIDLNRQFCQSLALTIAQDWNVDTDVHQWSSATGHEYEIVSTTLLQLVRDWSDEGKAERELNYGKIIHELELLFPDKSSRKDIKVLVPGCGLGRLVMELVLCGFWTQGNEISYHMLLTSNYILNHCQFPYSNSVFPFLFKSSHLVKRLFQVRPVAIPDLSPFVINELQTKEPEIPYHDLMSITAGSFIDLYGLGSAGDASATPFQESNANSFSVVVTSYFLDTASNIIDYLKTIYHCLKEEGYWINFGPLLWHFEGDLNSYQQENGSISIKKGLELSREDLVELIKTMGFEFIKHESNIETSYCRDIKSLGSFTFKCEFWVCRKIKV
ncbi:putative trehalase [Spathaspora passalidarum NRRL Y-27907]|uniref:carnosine N-methyltransferase n=1 Tax=Spathaspora passalidarum (strain NRRL Y-27907 / 11-Y1) TaxID=619300 RepID=G3AJJ8_SPAPN|nr:putative trehalase [Spathaspora passalidarum NRRL Y-27907]EGW33901.1 putative trehalase [Spathaspora passalidarum NRRL Y-27907]